MTRLCENRNCQKQLVRKRYPSSGKLEPQVLFERRRFCDNRCSVSWRNATNHPRKRRTSLDTTEQARRQELLNQWRAA